MFGLGYQELLLILIILGIPLAIIFAVTRFSHRAGDDELAGIRGWLLLVAIGVCILPFFFAAETIKAVGKGDLVSPVIGGFLAIWAVFNAVLFFQRKRHFPKAWIGLNVLLVVLIVIGALAESGSKQVEVISPILWTAVWMAYMLRSRRVKATFVQ